jgi:esterase/lipase superfamily enzyme
MTIGGEDLSWDQLVQASRTKERDGELKLSVTHTRELGRLDPTPRHLFAASESTAPATTRPTTTTATTMTTRSLSPEDRFRAELSARLARTPVKEVYIFVHGFANSFDDSICTIGELWHFFGRQGVPIAYTWPAGSPGIFSYMYDRESSEFTVYHFKQMLKLVASCPDVREINIICHSRGTDVVGAGLRELCIELRDEGPHARERLKLGAVVMAAPDLDFDVVLQRLATEPVVQLADQWVIYVCSQDSALGLSNWLFGGKRRLGHMHSAMFSADEIAELRASKHVEFVDVEVKNIGGFGHDYFYSNPAVSSDLVLLMRYRQTPGGISRRPLRTTGDGFWDIDDQYPRPPKAAGPAGE